jgi:hypothetical protein
MAVALQAAIVPGLPGCRTAVCHRTGPVWTSAINLLISVLQSAAKVWEVDIIVWQVTHFCFVRS